MLRLIFAFVDIALHRRGPEELPPTRFFFGLVLAANIVVSLLTLQLSEIVEHPALMMAVDTVFGLSFVWCVLRAFERERRFLQTAAALLGTDILLSLLGLPLVLWHRALHAPDTDITVPQVLYLLIAVWSIDVSAFIMARALDRMYVLAVAIMLGYLMLSVSLRATLFPPAS